jgi:hypothetical protein
MIERGGSPFHRWFRLIVNTLILIILLNGLVRAARMIITHPAAQAARVARAAFELQQIAAVIEQEELLTGSYPENFAEFMRENFRRKRGRDVTTDPWGNRYRFADEEKDFVVRSAGPDGVPRTTDDIYITRTKPRWRHSSAVRG